MFIPVINTKDLPLIGHITNTALIDIDAEKEKQRKIRKRQKHDADNRLIQDDLI